jgi:hypothetical protein
MFRKMAKSFCSEEDDVKLQVGIWFLLGMKYE